MLSQVPELPLMEAELEDFVEEPMVELELLLPKSRTHKSQTPRSTDRRTSKTTVEQQVLIDLSPEQLEQVEAQLRTEWQQLLRDFRVEMLEEITQAVGIEDSGRAQGLAERVKALEQEHQTLIQENQVLTKERDALKRRAQRKRKEITQVQSLEAENRSLAAQLQEAQQKLERFRCMVMDDSADKPSRKAVTPDVTPIPSANRPGRKSGAAMARAQSIFDALKVWNAQHPETTVALSPGLLETQFRIHRKVAKQFCEDFRDAIDEHHTEIGVEKARSHNRGKSLEAFKAFVAEFH